MNDGRAESGILAPYAIALTVGSVFTAFGMFSFWSLFGQENTGWDILKALGTYVALVWLFVELLFNGIQHKNDIRVLCYVIWLFSRHYYVRIDQDYDEFFDCYSAGAGVPKLNFRHVSYPDLVMGMYDSSGNAIHKNEIYLEEIYTFTVMILKAIAYFQLKRAEALSEVTS